MIVWHWHPEVAVGLAGLTALYLTGIGPLRRRRGWGPPPRARTVAAFLGGSLILAAATLGPLAEWAERTALSAHMLQHLLLTQLVPLLWLAGTPAWLVRSLLALPGLAAAGRVLTRPVPALGLAGAVLVLWHLPGPFEAALVRPSVHAVMHLTLLASAVLAWWPVAGPLPEWPRPAPPGQLLYLFAAMIVMSAVAAPITVAESLLYPAYAAAAGWPLSPRADQELAGVLMWVGGALVYLAVATGVFFRWVAREAADEAPATGRA
jgi:cytochrome c oxidase assembly factor CtaG